MKKTSNEMFGLAGATGAYQRRENGITVHVDHVEHVCHDGGGEREELSPIGSD